MTYVSQKDKVLYIIVPRISILVPLFLIWKIII